VKRRAPGHASAWASAVAFGLLVLIGVAREVELWRMLGAVATLALILAVVWAAGYRAGVR
jgi:hypothetical protein